jgi:hypothetical protein
VICRYAVADRSRVRTWLAAEGRAIVRGFVGLAGAVSVVWAAPRSPARPVPTMTSTVWAAV